jgi:RHS repeat-associated protein
LTTDAAGTRTSETRYYPYGAHRYDWGSDPSDRDFTRQRRDAEIALLDYVARRYSPYLNRWIQPDPIVPDLVNPQNLNRYSYVLNNPLRYADPSGHCPQCAIATAAAPFGPPGWVIGGVAALAVTAYAGGQMFVWGPNAEGNREAAASAWNSLVDRAETTLNGSSRDSAPGGGSSGGNFDPGDPVQAFRDAGMTAAGLRGLQQALQNSKFDPERAWRTFQQFASNSSFG